MKKHCSQGDMEDFIDECYDEIDEDYEFDASQFYDFIRPENDAEILELERWFEVSGDYPHSPFIVKLNLEKILSPEYMSNSSTKASKKTKSISTSSDTDSRNGFSHSKKNAKEKGSLTSKDSAKAKTKAVDKLSQARSLNFMEPTASHLAKQHKDISSHLCTRFQRTSAKFNQKITCAGSDNLATKRQKLETGYLKKGSRLKHQFSLSHKSSKKVTVPREPELETQLRAQRRRSKNSCASEKQKQKDHNIKAKARPLPQSRKSKSEFHGSHSNRQSSAKENRLSGDDKLSENPLIQHFSKLSLETNSTSRHSSPKGSNKNGPTEFQRRHSKVNQCGGHMRVHEASIARTLDIH